jgi:hypothetical protein
MKKWTRDVRLTVDGSRVVVPLCIINSVGFNRLSVSVKLKTSGNVDRDEIGKFSFVKFSRQKNLDDNHLTLYLYLFRCNNKFSLLRK